MIRRFGIWLQKVFSGQKSKVFYFRWYLLNFSLFLLATAVSSYLYPTPYSIGVNRISNLGGYGKNPQGALVWNIFIGLFAVGNLPLLRYINGRFVGLLSTLLSKNSSGSSDKLKIAQNSPLKLRRYSHWWNSIGYLGLVGMLGVGIFPEELRIWHVVPALMAFFGLILWLNWLGFAMNYFRLQTNILNLSEYPNQPDSPTQPNLLTRQNSAAFPLTASSSSSSSKLMFFQFQIPFTVIRFSRLLLGILDISFIIALFFSLVDIPYFEEFPVLGIILNFPLWEWISFCFIFLSLGFFVRIIPTFSDPTPSS